MLWQKKLQKNYVFINVFQWLPDLQLLKLRFFVSFSPHQVLFFLGVSADYKVRLASARRGVRRGQDVLYAGILQEPRLVGNISGAGATCGPCSSVWIYSRSSLFTGWIMCLVFSNGNSSYVYICVHVYIKQMNYNSIFTSFVIPHTEENSNLKVESIVSEWQKTS